MEEELLLKKKRTKWVSSFFLGEWVLASQKLHCWKWMLYFEAGNAKLFCYFFQVLILGESSECECKKKKEKIELGEVKPWLD